MTEGRGGSVKRVLHALITGRNTIWSSMAAGVFYWLMVQAIAVVGEGPVFLVAISAAGAATFFMVFRGPPVRPAPVWSMRIRQGLAGFFLLMAAGLTAIVGVLVVLHIAR
jgi:hypothetical protein